MKKIVLIIIVVACQLNGQLNGQINIQWESRFDFDEKADFAKEVVIDAAGNSYVTGTANNGLNFDIVTIKYDPDGTQLWQHTYNGPFGGLDQATGLRLDSNGDVLVGGSVQTGSTDYDYVALKINGNSGAQEWVYIHTGSDNFDECRAVEIDNQDRFILTGARENSSTYQRFMTVVLDNGGVPAWSNTYSPITSNRHVANAVTVDDNDNIYVAGESFTSGNDLDYRVVKYNQSGAQAWVTSYDGNNLIDSPKAITLDNDDNIIVTGTSYLNVTVEEEITTVKFDNNGNFQWSTDYGGTSLDFDSPNHVTVDDLNYIYVSGKVKNLGNGEDFFLGRYTPNGDLDWDFIYQSPTNGFDEAKKTIVNDDFEVYTSGYSNLTSSGDDYVTFRLDTSGTQIWFTRFDGPASASDQMSDFQIDVSGNLFVTGSSVGSGTNRDYSTIKYCQLEVIATQDKDTICFGEEVNLDATGGMNHTWSFVSGDPITASNFSCTNCPNPTIEPSETSVYIVTAETTSGCEDTDTVTVVVNPLPGPAISPDGPTTFCDGESVNLTADPADEYDWNTGENTQTISADTAGVYSLTVTDNMGCQNFTNIEIIVNPLPSISGGSDRFRCPGNELTFNASGADSLIWFTLPAKQDTVENGVPFVPSETSEYMVLGIDNNGCESSDTVQVTIFPNPHQIEIEQGLSGNLFVNTTDPTTEWYLDGDPLNHTGFSFFYDEEPYCNGFYSVIHTDENNCQSFDTLEITDACPDTANIESFNKVDFRVYPNPTESLINIEFESFEERQIQLFDVQGKIIFEQKTNNQNISFDISSVEKGSYIVKIIQENRTGHARIIKH